MKMTKEKNQSRERLIAMRTRLMRFSSLLFLAIVVQCLTPVYAQQTITVSGEVTEASGAPLPGVTVVVKGTQQGIVTAADGKYSLTNVPTDGILVFSFIGMKTQEVPVSGKTTINVTMSETSIGLDEVVAVGYGSVKKSDLTGAVGSVSADDIVSKGTTTVLEGIQGKVPGVDITQTSVKPGGGLSIQIRGQNSLQSGNPLYVVDGIVTGDIDFLNPQDIVKVDILKDASSTAIYGSRGSNGVVIITTKNAENTKGGKLHISYDGYYGVRQIARLPDFMSAREFADYRVMDYYTFNQNTGHWELPEGSKPGPLAARNDGSGAYTVANKLYTQDYTDWFGLLTRTGTSRTITSICLGRLTI